MAYKTLAEAGGATFKARTYNLGSDEYASATVLEGGYDRVTREITLPSGTATHADKDCIANAVTPSVTTHNLPLAGRVVGGSGSVVSAVIETDNPLWTTGVVLIIYDGAGPAAFIADNDPFDRMFVNHDKVVAQIDFASFTKITGGAGSSASARVEGLNRPFKCASDSQNLYFQLYSSGISSAQTSGQKFALDIGIIRD